MKCFHINCEMCDAKLILQPYDVKGYKGEKLLEREINLCTTTLHPLPEQYPAGLRAGKKQCKISRRCRQYVSIGGA